MTWPGDDVTYLAFISGLIGSGCRAAPRQCWFTQLGDGTDLDRPRVKQTDKPGIVVHGQNASELSSAFRAWFQSYSAGTLPAEVSGYRDKNTKEIMWIDIGPGSPWKSAETRQMPSLNAPLPAQPDSALQNGQIRLTGIRGKTESPVVTLDGVRIDSTLKQQGLLYVVVLVSSASRNAGIDSSVVQSVVDSLRRLAGLKVFFSDGGYSVTVAGIQSGTGPNGLAQSNTGGIFYYDRKSESTAAKIRQAIAPLVTVKSVEYREASDSGISLSTFREVQKITGVDIEVVL
jgi:hypothetical protein